MWANYLKRYGTGYGLGQVCPYFMGAIGEVLSITALTIWEVSIAVALERSLS